MNCMFYETDQNLLKEEEEEEDKTVEPDAPPLGTGRIKFLRGLAKLKLGCNWLSEYALSYSSQNKFAKPRNHSEICKNVKFIEKLT